MDPWWAEGVWKFVSNRLDKNKTVFEWGSGSSTLCLSNVAMRVVSVENDVEWFKKIKLKVPNNVELKFISDLGPSDNDPGDPYGYTSASLLFGNKDFTDYVKLIDDYGKFDLIVVDGRSRPSCIAHAISKIINDGMLLVDDPWRDHYKRGIDLIPKNWIRHDFKSIEHMTSVWVSRGMK